MAASRCILAALLLLFVNSCSGKFLLSAVIEAEFKFERAFSLYQKSPTVLPYGVMVSTRARATWVRTERAVACFAILMPPSSLPTHIFSGETCEKPEVTHKLYTTTDGLIVANIAFIAEFDVKCRNGAKVCSPGKSIHRRLQVKTSVKRGFRLFLLLSCWCQSKSTSPTRPHRAMTPAGSPARMCSSKLHTGTCGSDCL